MKIKINQLILFIFCVLCFCGCISNSKISAKEQAGEIIDNYGMTLVELNNSFSILSAHWRHGGDAKKYIFLKVVKWHMAVGYGLTKDGTAFVKIVGNWRLKKS